MMITVVDEYNNKRKLDIFKGLCFKNACTLYAYENYSIVDVNKVYELADDLYKEGIKRNYPNLELKSEGE